MKKLFTFLAIALFNFVSFAQLQNGGFENWNNINFSQPNRWYTSNADAIKKVQAPNVTPFTPAYEGNFSIKIETVIQASEIILGSIMNSPNPSNAVGGFPYTMQPDSFFCYAKLGIVPGDTGLLVVMFKNGGTPIGVNMFKITGNNPNIWQKLGFQLSPLSIAPDTVIIAALSSNIYNQPCAQNGSFIIFDSFSFNTIQPIPDGDFENWTTFNIENPEGYNNPNIDWVLKGLPPPVIKSSNAYAGNYALQIKTQAYSPTKIWDQISSGIFDDNIMDYKGGFAFSVQTGKLVGWYKYSPKNYGDSAEVLIYFQNGDTTFHFQKIFLNDTNTYTKFEMPFNLSLVPDTAIITICSSKNPADLSDTGSILIIDELQFEMGGHNISGKTRYLKKATAGYPAPNMPTYIAAKYDIDNVEVKLKCTCGSVLATTMSDANGEYQFANVADGNYMLSYDHIPYDTMQYVNHVTAVDLALLQYYIGHVCQTDPSRCFSDKHMRAANVDNNASLTAVDVARISAKIGLPYTPARNFPKGNWVAFDTVVKVAGADLNVTLETVAYGDYDASSSRYKDSTTSWSLAKVLPDENIIIRSGESIMMSDPEYFEVPLRISTKMNELAAVGLELSYPSDKYKLVSASMSNTGKKSGAIKINPTLEEIIAANNDLLVTDDHGIIRVVYATTDFFDISANEELVRLGFRSLSDPGRGELDFNLNGTGLIANQYGEINADAYLTMPKIFVQGNNTEAGFEFSGYPNPFSSDATLAYNLPENGTVKLNVYNAIGELVAELVNETQISGRHEVLFAQKDLSAGMYTFKLEFSGLTESRTLLLKMIH